MTVNREGLKQSIDSEMGERRTVSIVDLPELYDIDMFVDNSFVEIYVNKGQNVFSFRVFQTEVNYPIKLIEGITAQIAYFT